MRKEKGTLFILVLVLELAVHSESRVVKVPDGPLVRIEGQSVSIRCNVSDYQGPRDQDFEWSLVMGDAEDIGLISTFDPMYSHASVVDRVKSGDISVKKLGEASVELTIKKVRASDSATYRCSTPSTDSTVSGNYNADVELRVIGDTLKVIPVIPQPAVSEGGSVQLQCNASRAYSAHTVLSVTWSFRKGTSSLEEILTFGPDEGVRVGPAFSQRYDDGGLLLDLRGGGFYGVQLKGVKALDQGAYVCTAREWTRQPGGGKGWQKILERSEDMGNVTVTPTARSLTVTAQKNVTLSVEDTLNLTCLVTAEGLLSLGLEVTWLFRPAGAPDSLRELLRVARDGQILTGSELVGSRRTGPGTFGLFLPKAQRSDSGLYSCQVKAWLPQGSGNWYQAAEKTSDPVQVLVTRLEPKLKVNLTAPESPKFTDDPTELLCLVTDLQNLQDGRLSINWTYAKTGPGDTPLSSDSIATLDERGVLVPGDAYRQRLERGDITVVTSDPHSFRLRLLHTRDQDMGFYSCSVAAWTRNPQGGWEKAREVQSSPVTVQWTAKTPVLSVVAHRVREAATGGSTFEMSCLVTSQNLQNPGYSVLILFEDKQGASPHKVVSLSADSVLQLEEGMAASRTDSVALEKTGQQEFRFRLYGAQVSDRGFYYCDVSAWTRDHSHDWNKAVSAQSNKIEIAFADAGPVFNVSIRSVKNGVSPGDTAQMECIMTILGAPPNTGDVAYDVRWFHRPLLVENGQDVPLISVDRWGVVRRTGGSENAECSLERTDTHKFVLSVHHAQDQHMGGYYCTARLWYISASGLWNEGRDHTSTSISLAVKFPFWESVQIPVLCGLGAALAACLLSVVVGLVTAHCCLSRNPMHAPRNKLIDLEMD
ncbi:prostaglandin F2 receptor negative regulator [Brachyhypopomus gauderio]|uniref:prostaglandin F2 receptor negative regulator n=1 Tax=Brachyhypopomus gauderio TaxID=698409 RepID=UPI00404379C8